MERKKNNKGPGAGAGARRGMRDESPKASTSIQYMPQVARVGPYGKVFFK
jgi:hypothetical protein